MGASKRNFVVYFFTVFFPPKSYEYSIQKHNSPRWNSHGCSAENADNGDFLSLVLFLHNFSLSNALKLFFYVTSFETIVNDKNASIKSAHVCRPNLSQGKVHENGIAWMAVRVELFFLSPSREGEKCMKNCWIFRWEFHGCWFNQGEKLFPSEH